MAPMRTFEFIVIKMTLYPDLHPQYPRHFVMYRERGAQPQIPQYPSVHLQAWFANALSREKAIIPLGYDYKFTEWLIHSSKRELFVLNKIQYDNIIIFMGIETSYWLFSKDLHPQWKSTGSGFLSCPICAHCPLVCIENIIKAIQAKHEENGRRN